MNNFNILKQSFSILNNINNNNSISRFSTFTSSSILEHKNKEFSKKLKKIRRISKNKKKQENNNENISYDQKNPHKLLKLLKNNPTPFKNRKNLIQKYFPFKINLNELPPTIDPTKGDILTKQQLTDILSIPLDNNIDNFQTLLTLFEYSNSITNKIYGKNVFCRGIVEFSNVCQKNCYYCGIRKGMEKEKNPTAAPNRYLMPENEIIDCAMYANKHNYGSILFQSGEILSDKRVDDVCKFVKKIRQKTTENNPINKNLKIDFNNGLGVALCIGELEHYQYQKLFDAGCHRYLLRIETTNPELYKKLHPNDSDHSWEKRRDCLRDLKKIGFITGTGVMINFPGQKKEDLANDILFFKNEDMDMIGMGPYICQEYTPTGREWIKLHSPKTFKDDEEINLLNSEIDIDKYNEKVFFDSLKMIALTRIMIPEMNIAATTAMQAVNTVGREIAILSGSNVVMPIITPQKYRAQYQLYEGKPCIDDTSDDCRACLTNRINTTGKTLLMDGSWGEPSKALKRNNIKI